MLRPSDLEAPQNRASVGRATWLSDVAIMGPDGTLVPRGEIGEVVVRGDLTMTGYWRLPEKTAETLVDGWLHTGDTGLIDLLSIPRIPFLLKEYCFQPHTPLVQYYFVSSDMILPQTKKISQSRYSPKQSPFFFLLNSVKDFLIFNYFIN